MTATRTHRNLSRVFRLGDDHGRVKFHVVESFALAVPFGTGTRTLETTQMEIGNLADQPS